MMKRILVTGGAGFLGSHLCEELLARGDSVQCLDQDGIGRQGNIAHLIGHPRFVCLSHDVALPLWVEVDEIYHLAGSGSPGPWPLAPAQSVAACTQGAINLLGLARRTGARLLQAGASCPEEGQRAVEGILLGGRDQVDLKLARIHNGYGPRIQTQGGLVSSFISRALANEPIPVPGSGAQIRTLCYVDDLVAGLIALMAAPAECTGPMDLGNPAGTSLLDLAERITHLTGSNAGIRFEPQRQEEPDQVHPDFTTARTTLGWAPRVSLDLGLQRLGHR